MSNNTRADLINLPKINIIPELRDFDFDLVSHCTAIEIPTSYKIKQTSTPDIHCRIYGRDFTDVEDQLLHGPIIKSLKDLWECRKDQIYPWEEDYWKAPNERTWQPQQQIPSWKWIDEIDGQYDLSTNEIKYPKNKQWIEERNDTIENIRYAEEGKGAGKGYKYVKKIKNGLYTYRSFELYQEYLKEVESKGLVENSTPISKDRVTDDYFRPGLEVLFG